MRITLARQETVGRDDWYRRHTWTETDREEFFARLGRSRSAFHKAQYARIQAVELHEAGGPPYARPALELLDLVLEQWPDEAQLPLVQWERARCLRDLGDDAGAVAAYRQVFTAQRRRPGGTMAHETFAWWVACARKAELYSEALAVLDEFADLSCPGFPVSVYRCEGARALILAAQGELARAKEHARTAMQAAAATRSGFRYHRDLGVVRITDRRTHAQLAKLAAG